MVDNGANVNAATKFDKYTSLIDASLIGNFKIVQILIEKGANVNATTKVRYSKKLLKVCSKSRKVFSIPQKFSSNFQPWNVLNLTPLSI